MTALKTELSAEIPDANKQTVEAIVNKSGLYRRLVYTLNKHPREAADVS